MKLCLFVFLPVWDTGGVYLPMGITEPTDLYPQMGVFGVQCSTDTVVVSFYDTVPDPLGSSILFRRYPAKSKIRGKDQGKRNRPPGSGVPLGYRILREGSRVG